MAVIPDRFQFASAPDSWGVLDYPGPSWNQSYQTMLDEMVAAGYAGSELGRYGCCLPDLAVLQLQLASRKVILLASFVPVVLSEPSSAAVAVQQVRKVGCPLPPLQARFLVLPDPQS